MRRFRGDLLVGGAAIRQVDGTLDDSSDGGRRVEGRFSVELQDQAHLELGRPYLFIFDSGDSVGLVVNSIDATSAPGRAIVQFEATP